MTQSGTSSSKRLSDVEAHNRALEIAFEAHRGQTDRGGMPYVLHVIRVSNGVHSLFEKTVALLHDLIEDTLWTAERLAAEGFDPSVVNTVMLLTRDINEPYETYLKRIAASSLATRIKLADLTDNMDLKRISKLTEADLPRLEKYVAAYWQLSALASQAG